jgi:hypothetical protein
MDKKVTGAVSHARAEVSSLLEMLAGITDPRNPRGIRHRLVTVLSIAVVATLAGAANYRELGSVAADLPQQLLRLLGARWIRAGGCSPRRVLPRCGGY